MIETEVYCTNISNNKTVDFVLYSVLLINFERVAQEVSSWICDTFLKFEAQEQQVLIYLKFLTSET